MRRASLALLAILVLPLAGCGDSGHERVPPERMLEQAATHPIRSAQVDVDATLRANGSSALSEPLHLHLEGPYVSGGQVAIPSFDWRLNASALGFPVGGRLVSTGKNVYLSVYGNQYQVGEQAVSAANDRISAAAGGLTPDLDSWLASPRVVGEGRDGGVDCERIAGRLRGDEIAGDLGAVTGEPGPAPPDVSGRAEACVGFDDRVLHGLDLDADVTLPATGSAHVQADIEISDVGSSQRITAPGGAHRPIRDLFLTLNDLGVPIPLG